MKLHERSQVNSLRVGVHTFVTLDLKRQQPNQILAFTETQLC